MILQTTPEQAKSLLDTLETANKACNAISRRAWQAQVFTQTQLHKLVYANIRVHYKLAAQMIICAIAKVVDAYKRELKTEVIFPPHSAITYDPPILKFDLDNRTVSLWSIGGRLTIPFVCSKRAMELLNSQQRASYLCCVDEKFYLFVSCSVDMPDPRDVERVLESG
ncbi:MAG: hypothetical protein JXB30_11610 [Anaerolineae bacterium]|nr:hypothetical protein [Anaerolineae bacterium]